MPRHKKRTRMIYGILLGVGIIILLFGIRKWQNSINFIHTGLRTTAVVKEMLTTTSNDGDLMYKPVFEFTTLDNKKIEYRHDVASRPASWEVGEITGIIYDQHNPEKAHITTYFGLFGWSIILFSIAAPLIIIGGGYFLTAKYR